MLHKLQRSLEKDPDKLGVTSDSYVLFSKKKVAAAGVVCSVLINQSIIYLSQATWPIYTRIHTHTQRLYNKH